MTTLTIQNTRKTKQRYKVPPLFIFHPVAKLLAAVFLLIIISPYWIYQLDYTTALPDPGIWYLILLALAVYLMLLLLVWKLFSSSRAKLGLPDINYMVKHFKELNTWQQILLYWLSFALQLLVATGILIAVL